MIRRLTLVPLPKEGNPDEVWKWWKEQHAAIGKTYPDLRKYTVARVAKVLKESKNMGFWGMGEMWYDSEEAMLKSLKSPQAVREGPLFWSKFDDIFTALVDEVQIL